MTEDPGCRIFKYDLLLLQRLWIRGQPCLGVERREAAYGSLEADDIYVARGNPFFSIRLDGSRANELYNRLISISRSSEDKCF